MNHTERIAETARRHRHLSRRLAKVAVETYLELLSDEIAEGGQVEIHSIGKMQVSIEGGSGAAGLRSYCKLKSSLRIGQQLKKELHNRLEM